MSEEQESGGLTIERRVEALVDQLAQFDQRIRALEESMAKITAWCNQVYEKLNPIIEEYNGRHRRKT